MKRKVYGYDDIHSITLYPNKIYNRVSVHIRNYFTLMVGTGLVKMLGISFGTSIIAMSCQGD